MSIHHPRDYTPVLSDTEAPILIDWMTIPDEVLGPSPANLFEAKLAKINEHAQHMKVQAHLWQCQQEEEKLQKQKEEEKCQHERREKNDSIGSWKSSGRIHATHQFH
ncbi:hypothetical protein EDD15DRAFT_2372377 [Pisolithus albus]|nr:hypothetical protein EDD15DRAFT_2372377 [Pisolithus albus]